MSYFIYIAIALTFLFWILWRASSKRHNIPCPPWLSWMVELDNPAAKAHKAREIINALPIKTQMKVLDIGCGPGRISLPLAQKISGLNGQVTGLDISFQMLDKLKSKAEKLNITNIDAIHGDIETVPLDHVYDVILMICVLGEIPENEHYSVMTRIGNIMAPDAIISVTETVFDPHYQRRKTITELMTKAGFSETKFSGNWLAYTIHFKKN